MINEKRDKINNKSFFYPIGELCAFVNQILNCLILYNMRTLSLKVFKCGVWERVKNYLLK